jgi:Protein of unknown function (DUF2865)
MIKRLRGFGLAVVVGVLGAVVAAGAFATSLAAQTNPPIPPAPIPNAPASAPSPAAAPPGQAMAANPVCARLEGQLAILNRSASDPARAEQIKRNEDAVAKQQADLDRTLAQSRKQGCEGGGFFALFTGRSPACQPLNAQIQQMRDNLDHLMSDLEHLKSGNSDQEGPRRALIGQLAQNNCGPQYRAAAAAQGPGGFLDALFGGIINPGGEGAPSGTYRTVCVRTCDGYYFPISYSTAPNRFAEDQRACQRQCPATEAVLYTYRNPGEDIGQALSIGGAPYTELPNAFRYRKEFNPTCSCRRPGQSWADALKGADDATTLESGDIVVTDQNAKALSQPPQPKGSKPVKPGGKMQNANETSAAPGAAPAAAPQDASASAATGDSDPSKRTVRSIGPPFVAGH